MKTKKKVLLTLVIIFGVILAIVVGAFLWIKFNYVGKLQTDTEFNVDNLEVNMVPFENHKVTNIALLGLDIKRDFGDGKHGRSDAVMILTIDRENKKLKLSSIARDSYVKIERNGNVFNDKLTHAHSYGGPELAVKTINQNFDMDITDYVSVNYMQFAKIIDYIGGVEIDVDESEMRVMNENYTHSLRGVGVPCEDIKEPGLQILTGSQALAYSRNRYSPGGDVQRGNRHKEVLIAAYEKIKKMDKFIDYDKIIKMLCENCKTSLTDYEIFDIALWTATNLPAIESFSLPTSDCKPKSGNDAMINGTWYYIYDLDTATKNLHSFIKGTE